MAFRRPDALRIEIPGPAGARLVAVVRAGRLTAVLPAERAVLESAASAAELEALLGVALRPAEITATMDEAETGLELPEAAFDPPPHAGYRQIDAAEARRLLGGR
jgi:hypothetical protein